jgi:hypothetical protein
VLLAVVRASTAILSNAPQEDWIAWPQILVVADVVYLTLCFLLFEYVIES